MTDCTRLIGVPSSSISSSSTCSPCSVLRARIPDLASSGKLKLVLLLDAPPLDRPESEGRRSLVVGESGKVALSTATGDRVTGGEFVEICRPYKSREGISRASPGEIVPCDPSRVRTALDGVCLSIIPYEWRLRLVDLHEAVLLNLRQGYIRLVPLQTASRGALN